MVKDRIATIEIKWEAVIDNLNKELARLSKILDDADIKEEMEERWESLGNHSLQYLYQTEKGTMDQAVLQLMNKVEAYQNYLKEMRETFEELILMQEEEVIRIKRTSGRGRPRKVTIPRVGDSSKKESTYKRKEFDVPDLFEVPEEELDKPRKKSGYKKTKLNRFEIEAVVKQAYKNTPVGHRTLSQIHLRAPQISKGTVFNYVKRLGYVLDGTSVHEKHKQNQEKKDKQEKE